MVSENKFLDFKFDMSKSLENFSGLQNVKIESNTNAVTYFVPSSLSLENETSVCP